MISVEPLEKAVPLWQQPCLVIAKCHACVRVSQHRCLGRHSPAGENLLAVLAHIIWGSYCRWGMIGIVWGKEKERKKI